jgi:mannose-6-phosphate isomerase-like protein (cupin superfamily)
MRIDLECWYPAPVERVFPFLADASTWPEWSDGAVTRRRVGDGPIAPGRIWEAVDRLGPLRIRFHDELVELRPGRRAAWRHSAPWNGTTVFEVESRSGGTQVAAHFVARPSGSLQVLRLLPDALASRIWMADFEQLRSVLSDADGPIPAGTVLEIGDHSVEILADPRDTGDRYRLRIVAEPGGGPGIDGDGPHVHPALLETFVCQRGRMRARVGKRLVDLRPGDRIDAPAGATHGFVNIGNDPLVVESDVVFLPPGYRPRVDLLAFAAIYDKLRRLPNVDPATGEPPTLQMAVLTDRYREAIRPAGVAGALIRPLAIVGRRRGYRATAPAQAVPPNVAAG